MKKQLGKIATIEHATKPARNERFRLGMALLFIVGIVLTLISREGEVSFMLIIAAMIGGMLGVTISHPRHEQVIVHGATEDIDD